VNISPFKSLLAKHNSQPRRSILPGLLLVALALAVIASGALAAGNLVKNGSFEKDGDGDGIPNKWTSYLLAASDKRVCNQSYSGDCSFKMVGGGGTSDKLIYQGLPSSIAGGAGDAYTLKMWVKTKDLASGTGFATIYLVLYKTGGGSDQAAVNITDGTSGWALYTVDLTTTETYAGGVVQVEFYHNTGKIWLDKVKLIGP